MLYDRRASVAACAVLAWAIFTWAPSGVAHSQEVSGLQAAAAIETAMIDAIAQAEKSVVAIARVKREREEFAALAPDPFSRRGQRIMPTPGDPGFVPNEYGTGVVIDKRGLILTHYHVLGEDSELWVTTIDRKTRKARIKAADPRSDLAVLSIEVKEDLTPIKFGDASKLKKGQIVIALGNPYGIARDGQVSASWGIIANLSRKAGETQGQSNSKPTLHHYGTLIQTDAKLNLGTSGGALLNLKGEMVGLTTSVAAAAGYEQAAGYAVPVDDTFKRVVETLKQGKEVEYGLLGVRGDNLSQENILAGAHGMKVTEVYPNTPASRYGVQREDVITHVNGQPIYDTDGVLLHVGKLDVESSVRLTLNRGGKVIPAMNVQLSKFPPTGKRIVTAPTPGWRGLQVDYLTVALAGQQISWSDRDLVGVVITDIDRSSLAGKQGLQTNDYIVQVNNRPIASPKEFRAAVAGKNGPVQLRCARPENGRTVEFVKTIPAAE